MTLPQHKFSGLAPENHPLHYVLNTDERFPPVDMVWRRLAPSYLHVPKLGTKIAKWGPTKRARVVGFRPDKDCGGNFLPHRFQENNNCYNYACNIATNSFAMPGRLHGVDCCKKGQMMGAEGLIKAARADGLRLVGKTEMSLAQAIKSQVYIRGRAQGDGGHLVALFVSPPKSTIRWKGDMHWVRCDHPLGAEWSQKAGTDNASDLDFAGHKIVDPQEGCWVVNQGPPPTGWGKNKHRLTEQVVEYSFAAWMFVPYKRVSIL